MSESQSIVDGMVVTMHYKLALDGGQVIDQSEGEEPLAYLHGAQNIVPGLEEALTGKSVGDSFDVSVPAEKGYGPRAEEAVQTVPRSAFPDGSALEAGVSFQATDQNDRPIMGTIEAVTDDTVTVDFNHPLAGRNLNFSIEVVGVRAATEEETSHGHPHGEGGHHH